MPTIALIARIRRRSSAELAMLATALAVRAVLLVALRLVSFVRLERSGTAIARAFARAVRWTGAVERTVGWAVATAAVLLPAADSCLADALAAHWLLTACGYRSTIRFGIATTAAQTVRAHAWVEARGGVVVGAAGAGAFTQLR